MAKFKTLLDMMQAGYLTDTDLCRMATYLFNSMMPLEGAPPGYKATAPNFAALSDNCKDFIKKALLQGTVTNVLDQRFHPRSEAEQDAAPDDPNWVDPNPFD